MGPTFLALDHVQLAIPVGGEEVARRFYAGLLGLIEVPKPPEQAKRGGCWFESGPVSLHLGVEEDFRPARKAHPALRCRDYAALVARLEAAGVVVRAALDVPGVMRCHIEDPFGNRIELVAGQQSLGRPVALSRRSGITEFGHVCLDAPDVREAYRFWSGTFNAKVSDWIGDGACLMRIDPVHHKLAVFQADEPGLCHMNFQVAEIDDIFRNWHFLVDNGVTIEMGPGRHPQSTAVFLYFLGPEGFTYEYSFGVRRIEDDAAWTPRYFDPEELGSIDMWLGAPVRTISQPQLGRRLPVSAS